MDLVSKLLAELEECIANESDCYCTDFPEDTVLEDDESVNWITQTFIEPHTINIYEVTDAKELVRYISSDHSDGGIVIRAGGPWRTLKAAKRAYGKAPERWV